MSLSIASGSALLALSRGGGQGGLGRAAARRPVGVRGSRGAIAPRRLRHASKHRRCADAGDGWIYGTDVYCGPVSVNCTYVRRQGLNCQYYIE